MNQAPTRFDPATLRVLLVTDGLGDASRIARVVRAVTQAGVRAVQVREPQWTARALWRVVEDLAPLLAAVQGLLFVNDRLDVAIAGSADGAQLGHRSLPPDVARAMVGPGPLLGYSAHDEGELAAAAAAGCDFALLSPVWPTTSKPGVPHLGAARAGLLTAAARLPVLWLGGVTAATAATLRDLPPAQRPLGVAVRSELMTAADPAAAAAGLLQALA